VKEALVAIGENTPSIQIGPWTYLWAPEFFTLSAWRPSEGSGPLVTYYFAVNPWTGDVWDAMGCKRITSPEIQKRQSVIYKRYPLPTEVWESLRERSPAECSAAMRRMNEKKR
jgi:hypothetical protein